MSLTRSSKLLARWERVWFQDVTPHSYALLRILFGAIGFVSVLGMTPVAEFWTPGGLFSPTAGSGVRAQILSSGLGDLIGTIYFWTMLTAFAATALGYRSGTAVAVAFVGSVFQPFWNRLPLSSAHHVVVVVLFCLLWVECERVWSVDAWRGRAKAVGASEPIWPLRLIRFQIALIYLNSGLWKLTGEQWRDGSAVHFASALNVFQRFPYDPPAALDLMMTIGTYVTLAWEIAFPLLILLPWTRRLALVMGVLLHLGMAFVMELGPFSAIMIASYAAFLPPENTAKWGMRFASPARRPRVSDHGQPV